MLLPVALFCVSRSTKTTITYFFIVHAQKDRGEKFKNGWVGMREIEIKSYQASLFAPRSGRNHKVET